MTKVDSSLSLPRILCLHGGGVNADIFRLQARALIAALAPYFRLVFVDAPFLCAPHPDVIKVYGDHGPFRRWLRWEPDHPLIDAATASAEIEFNIREAMITDDESGASGRWVGIMGFSQGAKIAASWAFTQQLLIREIGTREAYRRMGANWQFVVLLAGRAPLVVLDHNLAIPDGCANASEASADYRGLPEDVTGDAHVLKLPTIHVHGLRDSGLELHRMMMDSYCQSGQATLVEWDGHHRVPIKTADVEAVVKEILRVSEQLGILAGDPIVGSPSADIF
ncbi:citrinin biosynthesis oxidoreductase CtnB [Plectosphaerella plurivora]|uniref:Citrinin biosynthesis oxidoreductase CtnB n=1 Tax=Plectosphaerella plurivora TaxID=936078 RepID=A0A9P8VD12_9PEZI|nr:citrinin biosynthesis oxidoreductase CtnB [Plectosphaerella plurivora]